jgi:hypothetical protein
MKVSIKKSKNSFTVTFKGMTEGGLLSLCNGMNSYSYYSPVGNDVAGCIYSAVAEYNDTAVKKLCIPRDRYAAIGTDGVNEVVWGLGSNPEESEEDAITAAADSDCLPQLSRTVRVTEEIFSRIQSGEVRTDTLGI